MIVQRDRYKICMCGTASVHNTSVTPHSEQIERQRALLCQHYATAEENGDSAYGSYGGRRATKSFELRLSNAESASYDGTYCWKITEFKMLLSELRNGIVRFSVPFYYPSLHGYKMCLQLKIRSEDIHHLLVFFGIMGHDYDNILQWPFTHRVTFRLINQCGGRDITKTLQPDPASSSFKKPKDCKPRIAKECPILFPLVELIHNFVIDDTVFIHCQVQDTLTVDHFVGQRSMYED